MPGGLSLACLGRLDAAVRRSQEWVLANARKVQLDHQIEFLAMAKRMAIRSSEDADEAVRLELALGNLEKARARYATHPSSLEQKGGPRSTRMVCAQHACKCVCALPLGPRPPYHYEQGRVDGVVALWLTWRCALLLAIRSAPSW